MYRFKSNMCLSTYLRERESEFREPKQQPTSDFWQFICCCWRGGAGTTTTTMWARSLIKIRKKSLQKIEIRFDCFFPLLFRLGLRCCCCDRRHWTCNLQLFFLLTFSHFAILQLYVCARGAVCCALEVRKKEWNKRSTCFWCLVGAVCSIEHVVLVIKFFLSFMLCSV